MTMSALILGIIIGWILEWIMDRRFWRKERESALRRDHSEAQALQQQLDELRKRHKAELKELLRKEREQLAEFDDLKRRVSEADVRVGELKSERDRAVHERDQASGKVNAEVDAFKARIAELTGERDDAVQQQNRLHEAVRRAEAELGDLRDASAAEVSELRVRLETEQAEHTRAYEKLEAELAQARASAEVVQAVEKTSDEPVTTPDKVVSPAKPAAIDSAVDKLVRIRGIGPVFAQRLEEAGITRFTSLVEHSPERLCEITGLRQGQSALAESWIAQAEQIISESE